MRALWNGYANFLHILLDVAKFARCDATNVNRIQSLGGVLASANFVSAAKVTAIPRNLIKNGTYRGKILAAATCWVKLI